MLVTHSLAAAASADRVYRLTADGLHLVEAEADALLERDVPTTLP
jgi:hypothetical protein